MSAYRISLQLGEILQPSDQSLNNIPGSIELPVKILANCLVGASWNHRSDGEIFETLPDCRGAIAFVAGDRIWSLDVTMKAQFTIGQQGFEHG